MKILSRLAYTLLTYLLTPLILLYLLKRSRKQPEYKQHIGERFGVVSTRNNTQPLIWIHAVSVGETRATQSLVAALKKQYPQHQILITCMTPTGRQTARELYGDTVLQCYCPYDQPGAIKRFLKRMRPSICLLMETEVWPNLIAICHAKNIPVLLLNARLSEKSTKQMMRWQSLMQAALQKIDFIAAQTEKDVLNFKKFAVERMEILGNLKFDISPKPELIDLGQKWRTYFGSTPILLCASTREGEEKLILDAYLQACTTWQRNSITIPKLLIVPRHPQRFGEVENLIQHTNQAYIKRSNWQLENTALNEIHIILGDSMGELFAYYALCDIAFIGGSLLPLGGQNLIEAASLGKPILIGSSYFNFFEATLQSIDAGCTIEVANANELIATTESLLANMPKRLQMGHTGIVFTKSHQGATDRTLQQLKYFL